MLHCPTINPFSKKNLREDFILQKEMSLLKARICVVGCGPSGTSVLYHYSRIPAAKRPDIVCYEKQTTWHGLWNVTWKTGMLFESFLSLFTLLIMSLIWQLSFAPTIRISTKCWFAAVCTIIPSAIILRRSTLIAHHVFYQSKLFEAKSICESSNLVRPV